MSQRKALMLIKARAYTTACSSTAIWGLDAHFTNNLLPQQKLVLKTRHGAKVIKKHDQATTPHQRAAHHPEVRRRAVIGMNAQLKRLKPTALSRQILALNGEPEALAKAKTPARD